MESVWIALLGVMSGAFAVCFIWGGVHYARSRGWIGSNDSDIIRGVSDLPRAKGYAFKVPGDDARVPTWKDEEIDFADDLEAREGSLKGPGQTESKTKEGEEIDFADDLESSLKGPGQTESKTKEGPMIDFDDEMEGSLKGPAGAGAGGQATKPELRDETKEEPVSLDYVENGIEAARFSEARVKSPGRHAERVARAEADLARSAQRASTLKCSSATFRCWSCDLKQMKVEGVADCQICGSHQPSHEEILGALNKALEAEKAAVEKEEAALAEAKKGDELAAAQAAAVREATTAEDRVKQGHEARIAAEVAEINRQERLRRSPSTRTFRCTACGSKQMRVAGSSTCQICGTDQQPAVADKVGNEGPGSSARKVSPPPRREGASQSPGRGGGERGPAPPPRRRRVSLSEPPLSRDQMASLIKRAMSEATPALYPLLAGVASAADTRLDFAETPEAAEAARSELAEECRRRAGAAAEQAATVATASLDDLDGTLDGPRESQNGAAKLESCQAGEPTNGSSPLEEKMRVAYEAIEHQAREAGSALASSGRGRIPAKTIGRLVGEAAKSAALVAANRAISRSDGLVV
eukprot:CAMPEP_0172645096 /NCGR_PEP_ID=MMETSP1068-20121228/239551_1 /TAXON_ID=35684 /ORGANISM="Pseudopedinella elastica, Strain CCMP716" /LENGTH=582 /DNA_ID=CAMNT_0013459321 /DNA_START=111 /DNA_END=1860 /DNA_ORIENTATION=-